MCGVLSSVLALSSSHIVLVHLYKSDDLMGRVSISLLWFLVCLETAAVTQEIDVACTVHAA